MSYKKITLLVLIISLLTIGYVVANPKQSVEAFSEQIIQQGAVGEDVIELQSRLQYVGFYNGKIDGVFGWGTYWALRNFQYEFGLDIDGLAGEKTKEKLVKASEYDKQFVKEQIAKGNKFTHYGGVDKEKQSAPKQSTPKQTAPQKSTPKQPEPNKSGTGTDSPNNAAGGGNETDTPEQAAEDPAEDVEITNTAVNVPQGFSQNDIQLMANAVYGEARGEPYEGQVAVAAVILNRVASPSFPNTVAGVIFEPRAFTAVADGQIWLTPNDLAEEAVLDAINGWDPTGNATYYFNPDTATSAWIWSRPQIKRIGKHIFCN
ncbi:spore cortex-lytic enzyme [Oceanobacillus bengalensis]|uniref:Spore cortex-lytic enzyme n=1 Tax=Oceanobacillus bengalensis TaxID=1435466 RepID=A0A494Z0S3_9BACI|nr:spore cortex-lytic enzyme [Oceanobacillus bengalensis]RKQ16127.1 spore cortex-lytic enzyme [Oceanobacillus bengalensis]